MKLSTLALVILIAFGTTCYCSPAESPEADPHAHEEEDSHGHEEDSHGHEEEGAMCAVTRSLLAHEFSELAEEMMLTGSDGAVCHIEEEEEEHGHEHEGEEHEGEEHEGEEHEEEGEKDHDDEGSGSGDTDHLDPRCEEVYTFTTQLLLRLNLTTPCCLGNETSCDDHDDDGGASQSTRTPTAQAYGYGFLMITLVSLASLLGLLLLPCTNHPRFEKFYKYLLALLVSLGASALFSDAVLHLIPEAFGLHDHEEEEASGDGHDHSEDEKAAELLVVWRSCVVVLATYAFFLFEFILHSWTSHSHSALDSSTNSHSSSTDLVAMKNAADGEESKPVESGTPEGNSNESKGKHLGKRFCHYLYNIKPLAWLIILGDGVHNFADGLALGAAISQSLSLGLSTMIALIFHEIPHELGDFYVLLSTGMSWYVAILFNFASALAAILGFFVGVAIGTNNEEANSWILAIAAGVFLYIALVDLLPELIHSKEKGWSRVVVFVMINIGFALSFLALLLLAIYEEDLDTLVQL